MPSRRPGHRLFDLLASQGLGVVLGQVTVLLLALGSMVIAVTRDGASRALRLDEIKPFFAEPSLWHSWFYLLLPVLALYALNTILCTWSATLRKWRHGQRSIWHHGAALMHVGFLLTLVAHLIGGWGSHSGRPLRVGSQWVDLDSERRLRLKDVQPSFHPNGQLKQAQAIFEEQRAGKIADRVVAYNQPLSRDWGAELHLLSGLDQALVAELSQGGQHCGATVGEVCRLGRRRLLLRRVFSGGHWGERPLLVVDQLPEGPRLMLILGEPSAVAGEAPLVLNRLASQRVALLMPRYAPGNPVALFGALTMILGIIFLGRRWTS